MSIGIVYLMLLICFSGEGCGWEDAFDFKSVLPLRIMFRLYESLSNALIIFL